MILDSGLRFWATPYAPVAKSLILRANRCGGAELWVGR